MSYLITSESVTEGHPDKIADQISDNILDQCLKYDPLSRVACEVLISGRMIVIAGEISTLADINYEAIALQTLKEIGYDDSEFGFSFDDCDVILNLRQQSEDISQSVSKKNQNKSSSLGAGDQGMMIGYATNESEEYMPYAISLANKLCKRLTDYRKRNKYSYLLPDGKSQITLEFVDGKPIRIHTVVLSAQHKPYVEVESLRNDLLNNVILPVLPKALVDDETRILINPSGRFVIGGPIADAGLTGRKIIADTYGGVVGHGGGAFSGKDASKVDRSGAYMARYIAKNIVASQIADRCEITLSYAIGIDKPVSVRVNTFDTSKISEDALALIINQVFDLSVSGIIKELKLLEPIYSMTTVGGHFGNKNLPWEKTDKIDELLAFIRKL